MRNSIFTYVSKSQLLLLGLVSTVFVSPIVASSMAIAESGSSQSIAESGSSVRIAQETEAQVSPTNRVNRPTLQLGSKGDTVSELQAALKLLGFYPGTVDGNYGETTASAVVEFKRAAGLKPDGVVDTATWQALFPGTTASVANTPPSNESRNNTLTRISNSSENLTKRPVTPSNSQRNREPKPPSTRRVTSAASTPNTRKKPTQSTNRPVKPSRNSTTTRLQPTPTSQRLPNVQYTSEGYPILRLGMRGADVSKVQERLRVMGFLDGDIDGDFGKATEQAVKVLQKRNGLEPDGVVGGATWELLNRRSRGTRS